MLQHQESCHPARITPTTHVLQVEGVEVQANGTASEQLAAHRRANVSTDTSHLLLVVLIEKKKKKRKEKRTMT